MKPVSLPVLLVSLLALAGCGSSSSSSSTASSTTSSAPAASSSATQPSGGAAATTQASGGAAPSGSAIAVTIKNLAFDPKTVHAKVGQTIVWTNEDGPPHNVTWTGGPKFTSSSTLNTNDKFSLKLTQAGTITYICSIHPFMKASIVVSK
ncbi:MAG TPA: plastocyanin/azurin family copper-binding protein [Solirubrobacteraceae bacterium]|nr:plastocyanin/azurin family copper-binding protein [Solirubrobacteraceae bacterium]